MVASSKALEILRSNNLSVADRIDIIELIEAQQRVLYAVYNARNARMWCDHGKEVKEIEAAYTALNNLKGEFE